MYYQFNSLTGRITGSRNIQPYFPIGVQPLDRSEPPTVVFHNKHEKFASSSTPVRPAAAGEKTVPGTNIKHSPLNPALKRKMELFQRPEAIPVFLKGGAFDKGLYGLTLLACGVGLAGCFQFIYSYAVPKN